MTYVANVWVAQSGHRNTVLPKDQYVFSSSIPGNLVVLKLAWEISGTNRVGSVVHELGVTRDLVDISLQVATLDIGRLEAPVERLSCSLVVAHEVQLLGAGVGLGVGGRRLDLLPGCLGAVGVVSADVCASKSINNSHTAPLRAPNLRV